LSFLVGKKIKSRKIFIIANTFLRKPLAILLSRFAGHFAQTHKKIFVFQLPYLFKISIEMAANDLV